jgi:hypothetical protein
MEYTNNMKLITTKIYADTLRMVRALAKAKNLSQAMTIHQLVSREYRRFAKDKKVEPEGQEAHDGETD